jgi:hypothetical protein
MKCANENAVPKWAASDALWSVEPSSHGSGAVAHAGEARTPAEVDAAGVQRLEHPELLGHLQRAVVLEHHPTRAHPQALGAGGDRPDEHFRTRAGQRRRGVVLGQPVAPIAEPVAQLGQLERLLHGGGGGGAGADRRLIEYAQRDHGRPYGIATRRGEAVRSPAGKWARVL